MTGIERIAAERQRQVDMEGWTPEHDDQHGKGELSAVAAYYAELASAQSYGSSSLVALKNYLPRGWPWNVSWWKPSSDPIRNLEKAGALIAAEIDRLERLKETANAGQEMKDALTAARERERWMVEALEAAADYIGDESCGSSEFWEKYRAALAATQEAS